MIRKKILDQVKAGNFNGINHNAVDLSEDLRAWAYKGQELPTTTQKNEFINELLSALPEGPNNFHVKFLHFKYELNELKDAVQAEISGEAESEYDNPDHTDSNTSPSDPQ